VSSNLIRRIAFAVVAIPAVLGIAWLGGWAFAGLLAVAAGLGARELYGFARAQGIAPLTRTGIAGAALTPLAVALTLQAPGEAANLVREGWAFLLFVLLVMVLALARRGPGGRPLTAVAVTLLGVLYPAWLLSFALHLRHPLPALAAHDAPVGMALLFFPLVLTWVGDTAAMAGGSAFGGPKMAAVVSPHKTWSGGVAGFVGTLALSVIYAAVVFRRVGVSLSLGEALVFGAVISVAGQVGDVAESLFKREAGMKDSSNLLPGHGGVLDRLDSLYFVLPVTVLLYRLAGIA
jgi:phosphatidate cytidylyltransferase